MSTKRCAADVANPPGDEAAPSSGSDSEPAAKRLKTTGESDTATTAEPADPITTVLTNPDTLSKALLFLDVPDVLSAARTCKIWNQTLDSSEDTLWLGLVRKHHPMLERITNMLPDNVGLNVQPTNGIPAPSKRWKMQFKRQKLIRFYEKCPPLDKPLSSYFFEIRFSAFEAVQDNHIVPGDSLAGYYQLHREKGTVHTVVESAKFCSGNDGDSRIRLTFAYPPGLKEDELNELAVYIYDRETGRKYELYIDDPEHIDGNGVDFSLASLLHYETEDNLFTCSTKKSKVSNGEEGEVVLDISFFIGNDFGDQQELTKDQTLDVLQNKLPWK